MRGQSFAAEVEANKEVFGEVGMGDDVTCSVEAALTREMREKVGIECDDEPQISMNPPINSDKTNDYLRSWATSLQKTARAIESAAQPGKQIRVDRTVGIVIREMHIASTASSGTAQHPQQRQQNNNANASNNNDINDNNNNDK